MSLSAVLSRFTGLNIMVLGDVMLDRSIWGTVERISPEAPVPILKVRAETATPGGAANVAINVAQLGAATEVFGVVGEDPEGRQLVELLTAAGIRCAGIVTDSGRPTTTKTRLLAHHQQIARLDREESSPMRERLTRDLLNALGESVARAHPPDGLIISDYAKGVLREDFLREVITSMRERNVFVAVDPKGHDFRKYRGAHVLTPNLKEAEIVCGFSLGAPESLQRAAHILLAQTDAEGVLITRGKDGISFCRKGGMLQTIPAQAREVYDVTGAGDTVISAFTLAYLACRAWEASVQVATAAAGLAVAHVGTWAVGREELAGCLQDNRAGHDAKILSRARLRATLSHAARDGKKVVFTNGCFDLLHVGHLSLLQQARQVGDILVVGVNSDASVQRLKGATRPVIPERERAQILAALACVDYVVVFQEDTPLELLKELRPDVLVKGEDYAPHEIVGKDLVESYGGRVCTMPLVKGLSTSGILNKITMQAAFDNLA